MSPRLGDNKTTPLSSSSRVCRSGEHRLCALEGCICECHDDELDETPASQFPERAPSVALTARAVELVDEFAWADPPRQRGSAPPCSFAQVEAMRANPGRWMRVEGFERVGPASVRRRKIAQGCYGPGWEAVVRRMAGDGLFYLYVRFAGAGQ